MSTSAEKFKPVPLAIVGIGCLFPKADSPEAFWANIKGGVDAVTDIPASHWRPEDYFDADAAAPDMTYAKRGAFLEAVDFNPLEFGITPNNIEATDTTQLLGMLVAQQALRDAGYATGKEAKDGRAFNRERTSVILGVTGALELVISLGARLGHPIWRRALAESGVEKGVAEDVVRRIADSYVPWQENSFPGLLGNVAAGRIANRFDLGGTNCVVDAACGSSLAAVHMAAMELYAGRSDMAITGGIDTFNDIFMYMCFSKTPALSPTGASRPFAAGADGTILGEGLGVVVLKRLADAQRDGDRIHAVIRSIGSSSDGKGNAVYAPSSEGQVRCLMSAYGQAGVSAATVELIEAHGTGTKVGDAAEAKGLASVMAAAGSERVSCALGSVKSMIGHTKAAAGIAGLIKAALALENKVLPPTIKVEAPLETLGNGPLYVNAAKRPWVGRADHPRRAGVSAFGFGGSNFHCVLEEAAAKKSAADWDDGVGMLAWSADTREELLAKLDALDGFDAGAPWKELRLAGARLRRDFRAADRCRLVIVAAKGEEMGALLTAGRAAVQARKPGPQRAGVYFREGKPGKLGVLFSGQGSQYVGMLRDLACQFPAALEVLEAADGAFGEKMHGARLSDRMYPVPVFTDEARAAEERALGDTRVAQPALGAAGLGAWKVLAEFGVQADAMGGHSFGELVALCAAGRIDEKTLHMLANVRGKAMAAAGQGMSGAMLAVQAALGQVEEMIAAERLALVIANRNTPKQAVLSGETAEIERAMKACEGRGIRCVRLAVSAAFHGPMVAGAENVLAAALAGVKMAEGRLPVYANTTGGEYPKAARAAAELLAGQLARPVEFVKQIEEMAAAGVRTFVEVGPGGKVAGLVRAIMEGREIEVMALDASGGKRGGIFDLGCLVGQLAAIGHGVDLGQWDVPGMRMAQMPEAKKAGMTVKLTGANFVKPRERREAVQVPRKDERRETKDERPSAQDESGQRSVERVVAKDIHIAPRKLTHEHGRDARATHATDLDKGLKHVKDERRETKDEVRETSGVAAALAVTQQSLLALQRMQEQTAKLHQQYLLGQESAQRSMQQLIEQQMRLLTGGVPSVPSSAAQTVVPSPSPVREAAEHVSHPRQASPTLDLSPRVSVEAGRSGAGESHAERPLEPVAAKESPRAPLSMAHDARATSVLLEVVAEKTGYPVEMLELDMSLDSDLGIDSIKRVEILSALQTRLPEAPVVKPEDLGRLQTLREIVAFLEAGTESRSREEVKGHERILKKGGNGKESLEPVGAKGTPTAHGRDARATEVLLEVVAEKTGYPVEMLELDMSLDSDLGIDSIKRVEILSALQTRLPEAPVVKPEDLGRLQTLREIVAFLEGAESRSREDVKGHEGILKKGGNGQGSLEPVGAKGTPTAHGRDARATLVLDRRVLTVVPLDGGAREELELLGGGEIWVTEDGQGLAARVVALLKERGLKAKVARLDDAVGNAKLAGLMILSPGESGAGFIQRAFALMQAAGPALRKSGAAGGAFLAGVSRMDGSFALNGHTPRNPMTGGLAGLVKTAAHEWPEVACKSLDVDDGHDVEETAGHIVDEILLKGPSEVGISAGGRVQTRLVAEALNGEVGARSLGAEDVVVVTGGARGVTAAVSLALARAYHGKLLLLGRSALPAAEPAWLGGLKTEGEIKKGLATHGEKSPRAVEEAYRKVMANREVVATLKEIEAAGARVVYRSLDVRDAAAVTRAMDEARRTMGPIAGIIHGAGVLQDRLIESKTAQQFEDVFSTKVDGFGALLAAAAGDALKVIVAFSSSTGRFGRKGQVAYAAANEVLNKMAQREAHLRPDCRVLSVNWGPWEGGMVTPALRAVFAGEGVGLIPLAAGAEYLVREMSTPAGGPVEIVILGPGGSELNENGSPAEKGESALAFERIVDVESHGFLRSHVLKGRAVLPVAMMVEWLAHAALHENPGLRFFGFDELRVFKGVTLGAGERVNVRVLAGAAAGRDGVERVPVEMRCGAVLHARALIVLTGELPAAPAAVSPAAGEAYSVVNAELYSSGRLFHGADLQGITAVEGWSRAGIIGRHSAAPLPGEWMKKPLRAGWIADPLALDAAFQLMILWCFETRGAGSLPTNAASYRQYAPFGRSGGRILIRAKQAGDHAATATIDFVDGGGKLVARMEGYECVIDGSLRESFSRNQLAEKV